MAEQTFRSPGFFEREIDLTQRNVQVEGVPAGIIGTSEKGPAFVPVTLGSIADFTNKFGNLKRDQFGPFAVREWLDNQGITAVTFIRVLGAGGATTSDEIDKINTHGTVKNAGFVIKGTATGDGDNRHNGSVQFIAAVHDTDSNETSGYPLFTDSDSFNTSTSVNLIRAMIFTATGSKIELLDHDAAYSPSNSRSGLVKISQHSGTNYVAKNNGIFKLVVSSAIGSTFANDESNAGIKIYTASLNPRHQNYIGNILNTDPHKFGERQHLLYADFPVEDELARVKYDAAIGTVAVLSGSDKTSQGSGDTGLAFRDTVGRFDTRYQTAKTTKFISQPFGSIEYDLFHFEALDDGAVGNNLVKISITNIRRSTNPKNKFGTFTVLVRDYNDSDKNLRILEQFGDCSLDPNSENYVADRIGDIKVSFNFNATSENERRLNVEGTRQNKSKFVRIVMNPDVEEGRIPETTLPFGFRGLPLIKMSDSLTDNDTALPGASVLSGSNRRLSEITAGAHHSVTGSILPPVPFTFKATKGAVTAGGSFTGHPGALELADSRIFWGVKFDRLQGRSDVSNSVLQSNTGGGKNKLIESYGKFLGITKLDGLVTGSGADVFCNNKFSLSRVALYNEIPTTSTIEDSIAGAITGSASEHIRDAAYIRNGTLETKNLTILDDVSNRQRITFATLAAAKSAKYFNRFVEYSKFTNILYGGFDGLNILDKDNHLMNDRASSVDTNGKGDKSLGDYTHENLHADSSPGTGVNNNIINSYRTAAKIMTDPFATRVNIVAVPGIREPLITDKVGELTRNYGQAIYIMDIPNITDSSARIYDRQTLPSVQETIDNFEARAIDNNYIATYFPDVVMRDDVNNTNQVVPSSIAAIAAYSFNDSDKHPWFAPAGFNRGALRKVTNTRTRLTAEDRNILYEARINPIANFPSGGFVIFGQKTLQQDRSALDRVNVRRMLLEVKRIVKETAMKFLFENNTVSTRARFVSQVTPQLASIQADKGIDQFRIVVDSSNNTDEDIENNRLNGKIVLVPTRAVEFVSIDFIITNAGVEFQ